MILVLFFFLIGGSKLMIYKYSTFHIISILLNPCKSCIISSLNQKFFSILKFILLQIQVKSVSHTLIIQFMMNQVYQYLGFQQLYDLLLVYYSRLMSTDNPLIFSKEDGFAEDMLISAGNFHGQYVAKSSDFLSMALFNIGRFSQSRIQRYQNGRTSNLPSFLTKNGGLHNGFMIAQYVSAALLSQSKVLVKPASIDSISTSASQQDHVSMGGYAARKARLIYENMAYILGIQLMCCLQSIDLIQLKPSVRLQSIKEQVRSKVKFMSVDRYYGPQIQQAKIFVINGLHHLEK